MDEKQIECPKLTADDIREVYESDLTDWLWLHSGQYEAMAKAFNSILDGRIKK